METRGVINTSKQPTCGNCAHFHRHYVMDTTHGFMRNSFQKISLGHCTFPRNKDRFDSETCKHFKPKADIVTSIPVLVQPANREERPTC